MSKPSCCCASASAFSSSALPSGSWSLRLAGRLGRLQTVRRAADHGGTCAVRRRNEALAERRSQVSDASQSEAFFLGALGLRLSKGAADAVCRSDSPLQPLPQLQTALDEQNASLVWTGQANSQSSSSGFAFVLMPGASVCSGTWQPRPVLISGVTELSPSTGRPRAPCY